MLTVMAEKRGPKQTRYWKPGPPGKPNGPTCMHCGAKNVYFRSLTSEYKCKTCGQVTPFDAAFPDKKQPTDLPSVKGKREEKREQQEQEGKKLGTPTATEGPAAT